VHVGAVDAESPSHLGAAQAAHQAVERESTVSAMTVDAKPVSEALALPPDNGPLRRRRVNDQRLTD
jgi:hypothetical protein